MKIKVNDTIKDYEGKTIEKTTIRDLISTALNNFGQDETPTAEQKNKVYELSIKLWSGKEVDFTLDDRSFIKERAGKILNPLPYGRLCAVLEEKKDKSEEEDKAQKKS